MKPIRKATLLALSLFTAGSIMSVTSTAVADEGRYQAHWNGKSYLILDTDNGHIWTYRGDSILYSGRIDGSDFKPPEKVKIWQQKYGKWDRK
jgi:hypothetical protein